MIEVVYAAEIDVKSIFGHSRPTFSEKIVPASTFICIVTAVGANGGQVLGIAHHEIKILHLGD